MDRMSAPRGDGLVARMFTQTGTVHRRLRDGRAAEDLSANTSADRARVRLVVAEPYWTASPTCRVCGKPSWPGSYLCARCRPIIARFNIRGGRARPVDKPARLRAMKAQY